ncbi:dTDP-glucose 4,6-dehydratase [Candidatus Gracilibacteria bacterium]|nr:dTDP-glucose 4,6-dehydratase [Candidatus Gracilibacteria bacterium]
MQKKILITGGAGFIGSNFVYHIARQYPEYSIVVLDKLTYAGNRENIADLIDSGRVTFVQGDISDGQFIEALFEKEKFTFVVNFAAETHVDRSIIEPGIFIQTNIIGTYTLLEAAKKYNVERFHQVSTDEVYGDLGDNSTDYFTETTNLEPNCPYAASKTAADLLVLSYFRTYKMHVTITRCSNNYGPYQFPEKLLPFFFQLAKQGKPLPVYGDGKNVRDWLYVEDHCEAIDLVLHKGRPGEVYNVGGHNEKQNLEIAQLILSFFGRPTSDITFVEDRKAHDRRYAIDPAKIEKELGWSPKTHFQEGIKKTFAWYDEHQKWSQSIIDKQKIDTDRSHLTARK